ncbi:hypothetical protein JCGZ_02738 [Jatropha curcas]|uniref:GATA-type domain-containing protein n=1 Tax=Jatropha curcas TaxID=180498 RepID=A0A067KXQ6_JATCU|nr:GATA transcription factor 7 [Jatropha curcas]KDP39718.1 hypothetical protein JCGZ_02738 [Jatropha curcas]
MDFYRNVMFSGDYHQPEQVLPTPSSSSKLGCSITPISPLDDLFSAQNTEVDVSLEWLSVFVEDCLSSKGNCLPPPTNTTPPAEVSVKKQEKPQHNPQSNNNSLEKFVIPGKARSKRKRVTGVKTRNPLSSWSYCNQLTLNFPSSDPPLLQQAYWLADSELIMPKKDTTTTTTTTTKARDSELDENLEQEKVVAKESLRILENSNGQQQQPRRCSHCLAQRTPQWRAGPLGPKTLCNACGVRYKSGRLLPEYRPAKSPTFVSYLHSNSHKKVMEMRMATSSTTTVFNS